MQKKKFGSRVIAFDWKHNGKPRRGVSINFEDDRMYDEFDGEWVELRRAKALHKQLGEAIEYIEKFSK